MIKNERDFLALLLVCCISLLGVLFVIIIYKNLQAIAYFNEEIEKYDMLYRKKEDTAPTKKAYEINTKK